MKPLTPARARGCARGPATVSTTLGSHRGQHCTEDGEPRPCQLVSAEESCGDQEPGTDLPSPSDRWIQGCAGAGRGDSSKAGKRGLVSSLLADRGPRPQFHLYLASVPAFPHATMSVCTVIYPRGNANDTAASPQAGKERPAAGKRKTTSVSQIQHL